MTSRGSLAVTCPTCGSVTHRDRPLVDLNTNTVTYRGATREVRPPQVVELIYILNERWPRAVSYIAIADAMWGYNVPTQMRAGIATHVCWARKELKPFGIGIQIESGRGYRMVLPGP